MIRDDFLDEDGDFHLPAGDRRLAGCMLAGWDLMFAKIAGADLTGADLYWASCRNAIMDGTILDACDFRGVVFNEASMRGASLQRAKLCFDNLGGTTDFHGTDLSGANLREAEIHGAEFLATILIGADLRGCLGNRPLAGRFTRFDGADLTDALLEGAHLTGAQYDSKTVFPRGFNPVRAGMVMRVDRRKPRK